ncbi:hypothetical protein BGW41_006208 [Actinomortierella wolfii]|nr:hypothetical protein BGW41_006208 [Actinomortierella wolfii]
MPAASNNTTKPGQHEVTVAIPPAVQKIDSTDREEVVVVVQDRGAGGAGGGDSSSKSFGAKIKGFFKRSKKEPIHLTPHEAEVLEKVKRRAKALDTAIDLGFAKIGLDPIIGLIPVAGDVVTTAMGLNVVRTAKQADIPDWLVRKMLMNVAIDFGLGFIPLVGDIGDFVFKANARNARLFEEFLYERAAKRAENEKFWEKHDREREERLRAQKLQDQQKQQQGQHSNHSSVSSNKDHVVNIH